ncbi:MAG: ABC transporter permease [Flavobacterium sp.]|nr:MAG: ABC transporter permease [Flavobacterium sp.]
MKRLLNIELQKLWKNRASRILVITYFALLSLIAFLSSVNFDIIGFNFRFADQGIFNFPYIWHANTYVAAILKFFLAVVIVSMIANEYTYGTLKQNLIDGLRKEEFIKSKFYTVVIFSAASTLFVFTMSLILGYIFSDYTEISIVFSDTWYLGGYFLKLVAFFSMCLFVGILVKRSAFALGFIFVWFLVETAAYLTLSNTIREDWAYRIWGFLPMESMSRLIKEPVTRFPMVRTLENLNNQGKVVAPKFYGIHWYEIIIAMAWTAIFMYLSYSVLKKRDL